MPNRIIKESIHESEDVNKMTDFQFRLWVNLIAYVDDYGRGDARPAIIKGKCFPLSDKVTVNSIASGLNALSDIGCICLYETNGKPYLYFPTWESHQRVRQRVSKYPPPSAASCGEWQQHAARIQNTEYRIQNPNTEDNTRPQEEVHKYGKYGWVKLTDEQYEKLVADLGDAEVERCIAYVDESAQSTGNKNKWRDWNLVIRKCSRDGWGLNRKGYQAEKVKDKPMTVAEMREAIKKI